MIADALEITRDLDRADDEAKVARHRLLECEQRDRPLFDLDLEVVDLAVGRQQGFGLSGITFTE